MTHSTGIRKGPGLKGPSIKTLYSTRSWRRKIKDEPRWLLRSATSAKELAKHRTAIECDCFRSREHTRVMQDAARAYDALLQREKDSRPKGRPKKLRPLVTDPSQWLEDVA